MKKLLSLCMVAVLAFVCSGMRILTYAANDVTVTVNGQRIEWENSAIPYTENNDIMLPLKKIVSVLEGSYQEVEAQEQQRKVAVINSKALLVIVGSKEYAVTNILKTDDGKFTYEEPETHYLDKATAVKNGDVFFPLKHFCAAFGIGINQTENSVDFIIEKEADDDNLSALTNIDNLYKEKKYSECIKACDELLSIDESMMQAYYYKAMSCFYSDNTQNAYDTLIAQLSFNPKNEAALYNAACAASLLNKEEEAVDLIERTLILDITNKSKIKEDTDFNNIRNNEEYKNLIEEISVIIGGELLSLDVAPIIIEGRTLLPLRKVFETFGAEVSFDAATQTANAFKGDFHLSITIGNKIANVNGLDKELDVPAMILNDRTLVPIRFVGESLNAKVEWDDKNKAVNIYTPAPTGNAEYNNVKKQIDDVVAVSVVDGIWPEPYGRPSTEGTTLIILKEKSGLDAFNSLSEKDRSKYVSDTVYENFALVVGCELVYAKVVYDGKAYYAGDFIYDKKDTPMELTFFEKGKPLNVVKQYKSTFNYKDFYLLPPSEQSTSEIGD